MNVKGIILLVFLMLFSAACEYGQEPEYIIPTRPLPTSTPAPTAVQPTVTVVAAPTVDNGADIVSQAMSVMAAINTFQFVVDRRLIAAGQAPEDALHIPLSGKYNAPDQIAGTMVLGSAAERVTVEFIILGDDLYLREQTEGQWRALNPDSGAARIIRENATLPLSYLTPAGLEDAVLVEEGLLAGLPVYHVRAVFGRALAESGPAAGAQTVDFWIGRENYCIYRVLAETTAAESEGVVAGASTIQIDYAAFGEPVLIAAPLLAESSDFQQAESYLADFESGDSGRLDDLARSMELSGQPAGNAAQ